jgi:hypothetical protein
MLASDVPADVLVMNALTEVGRSYLSYTISRNKRNGNPTWQWQKLHRLPTWDEVRDVMKAFEIWYRLHPITNPDVRFGPATTAFVDEVYEKIWKVYRASN